MNPILANALSFAFEKATLEGKITISLLMVVSLLSWSVIISKGRQLMLARRKTREFFEAYRKTRNPLELAASGKDFSGSPAYEVYQAGVEEVNYQLEHSGVKIKGEKKITAAGMESIFNQLDRAASAESLALEKGMIILTTAVAGGPFIGLLGTVWGVMETFSGIAVAKSASLTVMAPGVAGALIATVVGLFVAIPAMFAFNMMITTIRHITQELDNFVSEYGTSIEHQCADHRPISEEIVDALEAMKARSKGETRVLEHDLQIR